MALRNIRKHPTDDDTLRKKARNVININNHIRTILEDMSETMYSGNGVGLAVNQVGLLRRLVVIDIGNNLIQLVNPLIVESHGEQIGQEGCLSVPNSWGMVKRPETVVVNAINENGQKIEIKGEGLLARVLCHEIDQLNGILFIDKAELGTLEKIVNKETDIC